VSEHGTTTLFGLRGVRVGRWCVTPSWGRVVHVLTDDEAAAACPVCGVLSTTVRQRRTTRPRDLRRARRRGGALAQAAIPAVRCGVAQGVHRADPELPAGARVTGRLRRHVAGRVADGPAVSVAGDGLISWPISHSAGGAR
jgi:hypothetical protein